MQAGVSTACLYPQHLEEALYDLALNGVTHVELFINADSDVTRERVHTMKTIMERYGVTCRSVHPFACPIEPLMLFSSYDRRVNDMIDYYKRTFEIMHEFGAEIFVFHGNNKYVSVEPELYCERYLRLVNAGKECGITVAQENVERCQSGELRFLLEMVRILGNDAHFVLDIKQAIRSNESPSEVLRVLGSHVIHVHMSDHGEKGDCLPLGAGKFRIRAFLEMLYQYSPESSVMLELYRKNFRGISDLVGSYRMLAHIIASIERKGTALSQM